MKSQPSAKSASASSGDPASRPTLRPLAAPASMTVLTASRNAALPKSPGMPSELLRSKCPSQRQSMPSTAAMALALRTPSAVSMSATAVVLALACASASATERGR